MTPQTLSTFYARVERRSACALLVLCAALLASIGAAGADGKNVSIQNSLRTNQSFIERLNAKSQLDIKTPLSVFEFVLSRLPSKVTVYPSENYYYFSFVDRGIEYVGNLRLDKSDRDKGFVHFAYFKKYTLWRRGAEPTYMHLSAKNDVVIKRISDLSYSISYKDHSRTFNLVDLSKVKPPKSKVGKNETYIGPVYDESGIQFYLLFNKELKLFLYVLNEEVAAPEPRFISDVSQSISIGWRSGFAYYNDPFLSRKVLVGVHTTNSQVNNYYDGPFDQLPDNFIKGNVLRDAILAVEPALTGKIDRLGNSPDGSTRFFIGPYKYYEDEEELREFVTCLSDKLVNDVNYTLCFSVDQGEDEQAGPESASSDPANQLPLVKVPNGKDKQAPRKPSGNNAANESSKPAASEKKTVQE